MPIYQYRCDKCGHILEVIQNISDPPLKECKKCSGQLRKLISPPAIIFKGAGWYITDNPTRDRKEGVEKEKDNKGEKKTQTSSSDTSKVEKKEKAAVQA
ncbi:zinc ribbon domain-containing protein [bacterium]|nr:zinc ribbon domain-containing protein [bacterium]